MGYGGAETHVSELAGELNDLGHRVTVASSGGELVASLAQGVKHITLPRFSRNLFGIMRSRAVIKRILKRGGFDVVHAHARIPAYLCGKYVKRYKFAFIVTAHAMFRMTPALRRLSVWGERTIAVSEDIKQHLIDKCGVYPGHITVIPNGIDIKRFSPAGEVRDEVRRIIFVSRMDADCSLGAQLLCRIAGRLASEFPGIKITLTGGGSDFERISALAAGINTVCGEEIILVTGARNDVEKLLADADIFVGVSRAALEAAACCLPVILCGNEGYAGILSAGNTPDSSNFCGRGCPAPSMESLISDLRRIILMSPEERGALGAFGREYVAGHNSSHASAEAVLNVYRSVPEPAEKGLRRHVRTGVVICGYYGFGNTGDNAILDALTEGLRKYCPKTVITLMANNTKICRSRFGVRCAGRNNFLGVLFALRRASYFILGGGTLLQDATSPRSLNFYLMVSHLACAVGCRLIITGSGLGPLYGRRSRRRVAALLGKTEFIGLREPTAYDMLRSLGVQLRRASVYADLALLTRRAPEGRVNFLMSEYVGKGREGSEKRYVAVSLREVTQIKRKNPDTGAFVARLAASLDGICDVISAEPLFFNFSSDDADITSDVRTRMSHAGVVLPRLTPSEICGILSRCSVAVGMRLHMLVFALTVSLPAAGIAGDPKIGAFLDYAGLPAPVPADVPSPGSLISLVSGLFESRGEVSARLSVRCGQLSKLADAELRELGKVIEE